MQPGPWPGDQISSGTTDTLQLKGQSPWSSEEDNRRLAKLCRGLLGPFGKFGSSEMRFRRIGAATAEIQPGFKSRHQSPCPDRPIQKRASGRASLPASRVVDLITVKIEVIEVPIPERKR